MTRRLRDLLRSSAVAWGVSLLSILLVAGLGAAAWWRQRPVFDDVLERAAALDDRSRRKLCAHRANNIPMYRSAHRHLECIEIDVHVSPASGGFAGVYHPPDENNHGLTLEFLLSRESLPTGKLWLDTKDLSPSNWAAYLELLVRLIPPERRGDVIVESVWSGPDVRPVAAAFRGRGFAFSYYLPTEEATDCGERRTVECDGLRRRVLETLSAGFSHLSFDARAESFVATLRPDMPAGIRLLTWDLTRTWPKRALLDDVEVYIVYWPGPYLN
jgi:hypothetical protein